MQSKAFMKCLEFLTNQEQIRAVSRACPSIGEVLGQRLMAPARLQSEAVEPIQYMVANRGGSAIYCGEQKRNQNESVIRR